VAIQQRIQKSPQSRTIREAYTAAEGTKAKSDDSLHYQWTRSHLGSLYRVLSPGAGVAMPGIIIYQHLLQRRGFDTRVRHVVKTLGVIVLIP
jgi:hypothetical protein